MNTYIAFFKTKQIEVKAPTSYEAQTIAAKLLKSRKSHQVTVMLAEKEGEPVIHSTSSL